MNTIPDIRLRPLGAPFSSHVCIPGDLNGDGFDDVAICAGGPDQHPWVFVYYGGANMDSIVDLSIRGEYYWGPVLRLAGGDVDNDGFADLIVSEVAYTENEGKFGIYFGGATMDTVPDIEIYGQNEFGEMLTWIGDMTGDGWPEFAVSNPSGAGEIYIYTMGEVSGDGPRPSALNTEELHIVPNPSCGMIMIGFDLGGMPKPQVGIYDLAGSLVRRLDPMPLEAGTKWIPWNGRAGSGSAVPAGTYVVKVRNGKSRYTKRIVIVRWRD